MTTTQINSEIKKVKNLMTLLMNCIEDKNISNKERSQYYKEYLEASNYFLKLSKNKPNHNLTLV